MPTEELTQTAPAQRTAAIDLLKAAGIIGVLTIHCSIGGYASTVGSWNWFGAVFWGCLARASVPVFFMCSGALLLDPEKRLSLSILYRRNLLRLLTALFFWAAVYKLYGLLASPAGLTLDRAVYAAKEVLLFRHEFHLYYLHIMLLVYVLLPVTRVFIAHADRSQFVYALIVWFLLGIVWPTAKNFWPFTLMNGIPLQWSMNMAYSAVGYGVMGFYLKQYGAQKLQSYLLLFVCGFAVVFGGTAAVSVATGTLWQLFLEGMSPGVALMAFGLFGAAFYLCRDGWRPRFAERLSKASFCIYLVHMLFVYLLTHVGFTVTLAPSLISIPLLVLTVLAGGYGVYAVLSRIPVVNRYLI